VITVNAINDPAVMDLDADDSSGSSGADVDNVNLDSLLVTITNQLDGVDETLVADVTGTSIGAAYDSGTGILSLTGSDTVAHYEQVLRTITYNNDAQDPDTTDRIVTFIANDGTDDSIVATTTVTMDLDADDSSGSSGADFDTSFTEDGGAVAIADVDASLSDIDNVNLVSLTVTITNQLDGADETLAADLTGTSIGAAYDSGTGILSLTGADTVANYQQVLRTITYDNAAQDPDTTDRAITFVANDGTDDSNVGTTTVTLTAINDPAVMDLDADDSSGSLGADFDTIFTEDGGAVAIADVDASLIDVDNVNLVSLTVTITNQLDGTAETLAADVTGTSIGAAYDSGTGILSLTGADTVAHYEQVLLTITYNNAEQDPDTTEYRRDHDRDDHGGQRPGSHGSGYR